MVFSYLKGHIEALLFTSGEPVSVARLATILDISEEHIELLIAQLIQDMQQSDRGLTIEEVAGGYQMCTKPHLAAVIEKLVEVQAAKLSVAAMETLAIIAFRQPITRQEIEGIRGVKADRVVTTLLERCLIKEVGRKDALGRPILYGTTDEFLKCFGLKSLDELSSFAEIVLEKQP